LRLVTTVIEEIEDQHSGVPNDPSTVSKTERREDMLLSTLRNFVEALGGHLRLVARFPSETIELSFQDSHDGRDSQDRKTKKPA
jgi:hypothetical protein